jgi:nucleotide-binding universal stress UspA family protein
MFPLRTILYATDLADDSEYGFRLACALARDQQARLVVLHVAEPPPFITYREMEKQFEKLAGYRRELLDKLHGLRPGAPGVDIEYRLEDGDPATEILQLARVLQSDLIVLGTHGRRGLDRLLLGSVAEQVLRKAPCPVLTARVPGPAVVGEGSAGKG